MNVSPTSAMLRRVAARLRMAYFGRRLYVAWVGLSVIYALLLLVSRLLGVIPDGFSPGTLAVIPLAAAGVGLLFHHRPTVIEAARAVDRQCDAKDLYLTMVLLENAPGEFKPLVVRDAEARTPKIKPADVVPFSWQRQLTQGALALCLLAAGIRFLPQLDPFGKVEAAEKVSGLQEKLIKSQEATKERMAQVRQEAEEGEQSKAVDEAIEELKKALNGMQPLAKKDNFSTLARSQKLLGEKWMKLSGQQLKDLLSQNSSSQQFGGASQEQIQKWTRELHEGSTDSLSNEIEKLRAALQELKKIEDPIKRDQEAQKVRKRLQDLTDFASENVKSKPLSAAVQRALDQMALGKVDPLSDQALQAMSESLELTKLELKEIAQSVKDLEKLEKSFKCLQMAKQLNDSDDLDGGMCQGCKTLADYEALYAKLLAEGGGMGAEGIGFGGAAPEDDAQQTGFKNEYSKSTVTAGKVLLTLKSKGLGDPAEVEKNHREILREVKQGLSEAVLQEQVPPGYHDGIKNYFDNFDSVPKAAEADK